MTMVVGLTGGIGSGKTTVANLFAEYGIEVIDADIIARQVVEPGSQGLTAISEKFGQDILLADGSLNRSALRQQIFADNELKTWLNQLLHPLIRSEMQAQLKAAQSPYCLLVIPLLVENKLQTMTDRVLVVDVEESVQIERTRQRDNVSPEHVRQILASQASRQQRCQLADDIISNNGNNRELIEKVADLHKKYLALSLEY